MELHQPLEVIERHREPVRFLLTKEVPSKILKNGDFKPYCHLYGVMGGGWYNKKQHFQYLSRRGPHRSQICPKRCKCALPQPLPQCRVVWRITSYRVPCKDFLN